MYAYRGGMRDADRDICQCLWVYDSNAMGNKPNNVLHGLALSYILTPHILRTPIRPFIFSKRVRGITPNRC